MRNQTKPHPGVTINRLHPVCNGLVHCFLFNKGDMNGHIVDVAGSDRIGALTGVTAGSEFAAGQWGKTALDVSGSVQYMEIQDAALNVWHPLKESKGYGVAWWEYILTSGVTDPSRVMLKIDDGGSDGLKIYRGSSLSIAWGEEAGSVRYKAASAPSIANSVNIWRHFVVTGRGPTVTGSTKFHDCFVDGRQYATGSDAVSVGVSQFQNRLGDNTNNGESDCYFDVFMVWQRRLTVTDAKVLYRQPFSIFNRTAKLGSVLSEATDDVGPRYRGRHAPAEDGLGA